MLQQNVGIIGAGTGGTAILKTLIATKNVQVIGIADVNTDSPGFKLAKSKGIFTTTDFKQLLRKPGEKIVIDATGVAKIAAALREYKDEQTTIVEPEIAELIMNIVDEREELNKQLAEESSRLVTHIHEGIGQLEELNTRNSDTLQQTIISVEALNRATQNSQSLLRETGQILQMIRNVADQTKMLGLNAAIEAARAGEYGRGFSVVAESIRELADNSIQASNKVSETLKHIEHAILDSSGKVKQVVTEIQSLETSQTNLTQEIHSSLEEMNDSAMVLQRLADTVKK